jgi:hypothetical protein
MQTFAEIDARLYAIEERVDALGEILTADRANKDAGDEMKRLMLEHGDLVARLLVLPVT